MRSDESAVFYVEEDSWICEAGREFLFHWLKFPPSRFEFFAGAGDEPVLVCEVRAMCARMLNECYSARISMSGIGWRYI